MSEFLGSSCVIIDSFKGSVLSGLMTLVGKNELIVLIKSTLLSL